ncbi:hypothetical protein NP493_586g01025 [Ridgeia piscesae]|uniref:G-protein coupled receptors family 1 profile domain-containing protein n=1 Tax=Ridgeia piscesae TaxID=27915 RepID=A0AAD9KVS4_RIDPI|nr:hypothetical protein NP493_586g01025 [Ridgeia piscesae]
METWTLAGVGVGVDSGVTGGYVHTVSLPSNGSVMSNASAAWRGDHPDINAFAYNDTFMSREEIQRLLAEHYQSMVPVSNFTASTQVVLIVAFTLLIVFGATGNGLVCYVVAKNPHMRTPRNIFIINLAISDLTLCLFTQPFNLMKVSMSVWHLGDFMCKFVPMFSGTNVFVSTISITAIALDRFQVIVYPTKGNMKNYGTVVALVSIWVISLLMASPLLIFNVTHGVEPYPGVILYRVCVENPGLHYEKGRLLRRVDDLPVPRAHRHRVGGARAHLQQAQVPHGQPAARGRRHLRVPEASKSARGTAQAQDQHAAHRHRGRVRRQLDAAQRLQHPRRFRPGALQADGQGRHGVRRVPPAGARVGVHQPRAVRLAERQLPAGVRQHLLRVVRETEAASAGRQRSASAGEH